MTYFLGQYVSKDFDKAIHYLSLAAKQNDPEAQFMLFVIYISDCPQKDINKAINLQIKTMQKHSLISASFIYQRNIFSETLEKQFYYFTLASDKNHSEAQFFLGSIYIEGRYVSKDVNKAIHYLSLAAKS